tara:strand:- start:171 stop:383 length:213 start_codon:yes stop_codon:yes gene_type:complete
MDNQSNGEAAAIESKAITLENISFLKNIYLFDTELDVKEGHEHEKLLYYWPEEADMATKTRVYIASLVIL